MEIGLDEIALGLYFVFMFVVAIRSSLRNEHDCLAQ
jgi:hypothetical protein